MNPLSRAAAAAVPIASGKITEADRISFIVADLMAAMTAEPDYVQRKEYIQQCHEAKRRWPALYARAKAIADADPHVRTILADRAHRQPQEGHEVTFESGEWNGKPMQRPACPCGWRGEWKTVAGAPAKPAAPPVQTRRQGDLRPLAEIARAANGGDDAA